MGTTVDRNSLPPLVSPQFVPTFDGMSDLQREEHAVKHRCCSLCGSEIAPSDPLWFIRDAGGWRIRYGRFAGMHRACCEWYLRGGGLDDVEVQRVENQQAAELLAASNPNAGLMFMGTAVAQTVVRKPNSHPGFVVHTSPWRSGEWWLKWADDQTASQLGARQDLRN